MKLLKFGSAWCQSCKTQTALLSSIDLSEYIVEYIDIDIDNLDRQALSKMKVSGIPTLIIQDDQGNELKRKSGSLTKKQLQDFLGI
jgi:thiol-disulfide isomerase/thioredoxin